MSSAQLFELLATPVPATLVPDIDLQGTPASEEVILSVHQVIFDVFACLNAGEPLRAYSFYSEEYLRRILARHDLERLELPSAPSPLESDEWTVIIEIRDVRLLDDGRAYATVVLDPGLIPVEKTFGFYLTEIDGRWLVDDVLDELEFSLA